MLLFLCALLPMCSPLCLSLLPLFQQQTHALPCAQTHTHTRTHTHAHTHAHTHTHTHTYTCTQTHTYTHIHKHAHTQTRTRTLQDAVVGTFAEPAKSAAEVAYNSSLAFYARFCVHLIIWFYCSDPYSGCCLHASSSGLFRACFSICFLPLTSILLLNR
jgi:carbohydrate-binding DOMON domain-containing protein